MRVLCRKLSEVLDKFQAYTLRYGCMRWCKRIMKKQRIPDRPAEGEQLYIKKWRQLSSRADAKYYRIFSKYIGPDPNILPEDISHNIIERILNPFYYRPYYSDKNMFDKLFPDGEMPGTLLRRVQGFWYDKNYISLRPEEIQIDKYIAGHNKIILKPAVDSSSGRGILLFERQDDGLFYDTGEWRLLDVDFLSRYGTDWILQEYVEQSSYMRQFNPTSVNTIRVLTYMSHVDGAVKTPGIFMRIGEKGSYVDNAHAGGLFVGVDRNGELGKYLCDQNGNKYGCFNGVDFANNTFVIPAFDKVLDFARSVGAKIPHLRVLQLDIMIDGSNRPRIIEFNCNVVGTWAFQFAMSPVFGEYTDEIIDYCKRHKKRNKWKV